MDSSAPTGRPDAIVCRPLAPGRWDDLETLFGPRGATGGCWCMWWRTTQREFEASKGEANRAAFQRLVESGAEPGLLAYAQEEPIGWCAVAPRDAYVRLARSRILRPVDDLPVSSVTCFFVAKSWRRKGVSTALLRAAIDFVRERGGRIVEGYPTDSAAERQVDAFVYTGIASVFRDVGFVEVARRSPTRPIMRYSIE